MYNKIKNEIKSFDLFGHPINLRFGKHGHEYKTVMGGIVSLFIKAFMIVMISEMFYNMIGYRSNTILFEAKMMTNE